MTNKEIAAALAAIVTLLQQQQGITTKPTTTKPVKKKGKAAKGKIPLEVYKEAQKAGKIASRGNKPTPAQKKEYLALKAKYC